MGAVGKNQGSLDCIEEMGTKEDDTSSISKKENVIRLSNGSSTGVGDFLVKREKFGKLKPVLGGYEKARSKSNACYEGPGNGGRLEDWTRLNGGGGNTTWDMYGESLSKMEIACDDG